MLKWQSQQGLTHYKNIFYIFKVVKNIIQKEYFILNKQIF